MGAFGAVIVEIRSKTTRARRETDYSIRPKKAKAASQNLGLVIRVESSQLLIVVTGRWPKVDTICPVTPVVLD
jgi:hypothetical protein